MGVWQWALHTFGIDNAAGPWYAFWSGFGSDLGELAIIGGLLSVYQRHACHVHRCFRWGRHPVDGTSFVVCRRHHPDVPNRVTAEHVIDAHQKSAKRHDRE